MRSQFLGRAFLSHLLFIGVVAVVCHIPRAPWGVFACGFFLTGVQLLCWYWTDLLLTDRMPGERMIRESRVYVGPDGHPTQDSELKAWCMLAGFFGPVDTFVLCIDSALWPIATGIIAVFDLALLTFALFASDAFAAFTFCVWPRSETERQEREYRAEIDSRRRLEVEAQERRRCEAQAARTEAERFYAAHQDLLRDDFPEALFRSALNAAIPEGTSPADSWAAVKKIIEQLQPRIEKVKEVRRQQEERRQLAEASACKTQTQIEALQKRIDALVGRDDEESLELLAILRRQMAQLKGKSTRNPITTDDL